MTDKGLHAVPPYKRASKFKKGHILKKIITLVLLMDAIGFIISLFINLVLTKLFLACSALHTYIFVFSSLPAYFTEVHCCSLSKAIHGFFTISDKTKSYLLFHLLIPEIP